MRRFSRLLPRALAAALILCPASVTATAIAGNGNVNGTATPPAATPETGSAAPATPPGQAKKTDPTAPVTPAGQAKKPTPATTTTTLDGTEPAGAVVDARHGTVVLRSAIDARGGTQAATIRGAVFEVRQSATENGVTDLLLKGGRPKRCPAPGAAAVARAAMAHGTGTTARRKHDRLWARDNHGRFRTRGRNSVATVRGTRWSTRETCAGTLTRVMAGAVDVFDLRTHRTVRVRAGHTYLARTSG